MTVEELNVKITADAEGFKNEIIEVNQKLEELRAKLRTAGVEATAAFSGMMKLAARTESVGAQSAEAAAVTDGGSIGSGAEANIFTFGAPSYLKDMIPAARVPSLRRSETVAGALGDSRTQGGEQQPIQINTTVELDGDVIGEAVSRYSARQQRMLND